MYKPPYVNTGVAVLSPTIMTIELVLAVRCFHVVSVWIRPDKIIERSQQKQGITSPPLVTATSAIGQRILVKIDVEND